MLGAAGQWLQDARDMISEGIADQQALMADYWGSKGAIGNVMQGLGNRGLQFTGVLLNRVLNFGSGTGKTAATGDVRGIADDAVTLYMVGSIVRDTLESGRAAEGPSYPDIALGKFNVAGQESLGPFASNVSQQLGRPVTTFNDWSWKALNVQKGDQAGLIMKAMEEALNIHFNMNGVNWRAAMEGEGAYLSAEWELNQIVQNGWLGKTIFHW